MTDQAPVVQEYVVTDITREHLGVMNSIGMKEKIVVMFTLCCRTVGTSVELENKQFLRRDIIEENLLPTDISEIPFNPGDTMLSVLS